MDIYNCPAVFVVNSVFAYNGPADVLKAELYRGHSGALSIGVFVSVRAIDKKLYNTLHFKGSLNYYSRKLV